MKPVRKNSTPPSRVVRQQKSAGISKASIMSMYRKHMAQRPAQKPVTISQINTVIGTNSSWSNAQVINREAAWVNLNNASYVWSARDLSSQNCIISKTFQLDPRRSILRARLSLSVDNYAVVLVNGQIVLFDTPQDTPAFYTSARRFNIRSFLRRGANDIVIIAFNFPGPRSAANPAGVAARLNIRLSD